jgi:PAS domain S-box-containing protein
MQFFNNMLLAMTGYKVEELQSSQACSIEPFIIPEDRPDIMATVKNAILEDKPFEVEYRLKHKDGRIRYFFERGRPIRGTDGKPLHIDGVILDITEHRQAEDALRKRETELEAQSHHLKEVNTALRVLLEQREEDKKDLEENVLSNVKQLVNPHIEALKKSRLDANQRTFVSILESNLNNIVSSFTIKLSSKLSNLTPMEIRVADFVKEGKTNKEIAELLCLSKNTILSHRFHIRSKLGLKNQKINLRTHLLSLTK